VLIITDPQIQNFHPIFRHHLASSYTMMLTQEHLDELLVCNKLDHMEVVGKSIHPYSDEKVTCAICLTPYYCKDAEGNPESPKMLPCGHIFGGRCFRSWNKHAAARLTCPMCRFPLHFKICGHSIMPLPVSPPPPIIKAEVHCSPTRTDGPLSSISSL
jgi:hypothetical protein